MNPATRIWDIPPPPGTEEEFDIDTSNEKSSTDMPEEKAEENSPLRAIDRIDPYLKNPEYVDYEKRHRKKSRSRTRSKSKDRHRRRRYSRSRSRSRHRRSRSKSRRHRRRYSSSHSRSRSPSHRHSRHKRSRRRHSPSRHSRSRSRSISKSHHRRRRTRSPKDKASSTAVKHESEEQPLPDLDVNEVDMKIEEEEEEDDVKDNVFKNDGSFLEMFKKMQEQQQQKVTEEPVSSLDQIKKPVLPVFGKRRGGKVLKTGMVQKLRQPSEEENNAQDAWSIYMKEVRRYKEAHCDDDSKTRPLVK